jgi:hypothetical protein
MVSVYHAVYKSQRGILMFFGYRRPIGITHRRNYRMSWRLLILNSRHEELATNHAPVRMDPDARI